MTMLNSEWRRKAIIALLKIEGCSILALGTYLILKGLTSHEGIEWFVISGILILALAGGLGLLLSANGYKSKKMYGRAPAILANLIALGVSKYMYEANLWWTAIPITLCAVLTIYFALSLVPNETKKKA